MNKKFISLSNIISTTLELDSNEIQSLISVLFNLNIKHNYNNDKILKELINVHNINIKLNILSQISILIQALIEWKKSFLPTFNELSTSKIAYGNNISFNMPNYSVFIDPVTEKPKQIVVEVPVVLKNEETIYDITWLANLLLSVSENKQMPLNIINILHTQNVFAKLLLYIIFRMLVYKTCYLKCSALKGLKLFHKLFLILLN